MLNLNSLIYLLIILGTILKTTLSAQATSFSDDFEDGVINTSVYSTLGNAILTEGNGQLNLTMNSDGDGINMFFGSVTSQAEWFMTDFETLSFLDAQNFTINIFDSANNLNFAVVTLFEAIPIQEQTSLTSSNLLTSNNVIEKSCFAKVLFQGREVGTIFVGKAKFLEPNFWECPSVKGSFRVDWLRRKNEWIWTYEFASKEGGVTDQAVFDSLPLLPDAQNGNVKNVEVVLGSSVLRDPNILFNNVGVMPIHVSEPRFTIGLLGLGILGLGLTFNKLVR